MSENTTGTAPWLRELLRCPVTGATLVDGVGPGRRERVVQRIEQVGRRVDQGAVEVEDEDGLAHAAR